MNKQEMISKTIELQTQKKEKGNNHAIHFKNFDGTLETVETSGVIMPLQNGIMEWRDADGIFHLTAISSYKDVYFDKSHMKMIDDAYAAQKSAEENQK